MADNSRKAVPAVHVVDESDKVMDKTADDNNLARTRVASFDAENDRLHRKYGEMEKELSRLKRDNNKLRKENASLNWHLKRRSRALWTGFVALEVKAVYFMSTDAWGAEAWWANAGQAATGVAIAAYLVWPNIRNLVKLSRDPAMRPTGDSDTK